MSGKIGGCAWPQWADEVQATTEHYRNIAGGVPADVAHQFYELQAVAPCSEVAAATGRATPMELAVAFDVTYWSTIATVAVIAVGRRRKRSGRRPPPTTIPHLAH